MQQMQVALSWLLKVGILIALALTGGGGMMYLYQHGQERMYYHVFYGQPTPATSTAHILQAASMLKPLALIQLGIMVLIITQIVRVALIAGCFARLKEYTFSLMSGFILVMLLVVSLGFIG